MDVPVLPTEGSADRGARRRVLLVDDNEGDARLESERLNEGLVQFDVLHARSVGEAIGLLPDRQIEAVILDLGLPDSEGIETVRRVRSMRQSVPIIVVTGDLHDGLRGQAIDAGGDEVYSKAESNSRLFWRSVLHIIERKRAQQDQLRHLLDALPDAVLVANMHGVVRYVNRGATRLFGRTRRDLLGETVSFSVRDGVASELRIPRADGERECEIRVVPMFWSDEPTHLAVIRDLTAARQAERLRARAEALEAENTRIAAATRAKSVFLANMSHELRTPLNAIIGFSQMIVDGAVDPRSPQIVNFVGHILTSGRHLLDLINDLLDLAKIEAGKLEFRPLPVDTAALLAEVTEVLGSISTAKRIGIETQVDACVRSVVADPGRLRQVLYNYLSNALKFTPEGGSVSVRIGPEGERSFRIDVTDNGIGIAAEDLSKLFTEFLQLEGGTDKRHQGTGLGLALTRRLVEAQGGAIAVRSELGRGSTFSAILPRKPESIPSKP